VAFLFAAIVGLVFGAADQYLGSMLWLGSWTATAAQVSAPWLILPFAAGMTQWRPRRAAALGLVVTLSALFDYWAMTYSPMEIHPWIFHRFTAGLVAVTTRGWYNPLVILGGLVMGRCSGCSASVGAFGAQRSVLRSSQALSASSRPPGGLQAISCRPRSSGRSRSRRASSLGRSSSTRCWEPDARAVCRRRSPTCSGDRHPSVTQRG
jgi:hypothetical protein